MTTWDPETYLGFASERARPAHDLLARVEARSPRRIVDLGCGAGGATLDLSRRWPGARVTGVDTSAEMLERARRAAEAAGAIAVEWVRADLADWEPEEAPDVVFSNAALHWLPDHDRLVQRLFAHLAPGGTLAFQVPGSWGEPLLVEMRASLASIGRTDVLARIHRPWVLGARGYGELLAPLAATLDVWETRYHHRLEGEDPVLAWVEGTALRPVLALLAGSDRARFLEDYRRRLGACYPAGPGGVTVLPFPRLFVVARAPAS